MRRWLIALAAVATGGLLPAPTDAGSPIPPPPPGPLAELFPFVPDHCPIACRPPRRRSASSTRR
jgi:hypothetical protein